MKIKMGFKGGANGTTSDLNYWAKMKGRQQEVAATGTSSCLHQLQRILKYMHICSFDPTFPHSCLFNLY